ncbi:MAG: ABC transporter substrate-binding protein, partial [Actinomycetes bacterium]
MRTVSPIRRGRGALAVLAAAVLALSACGGNNAQDEQARKSLTINTSFVVKSLDPGAVYEATGNVVVHALYD